MSQQRLPGLNIWKTTLSAVLPFSSMPAMHANGQRATLARYPNADPEYDQFPTGYVVSGESALTRHTRFCPSEHDDAVHRRRRLDCTSTVPAVQHDYCGTAVVR